MFDIVLSQEFYLVEPSLQRLIKYSINVILQRDCKA